MICGEWFKMAECVEWYLTSYFSLDKYKNLKIFRNFLYILLSILDRVTLIFYSSGYIVICQMTILTIITSKGLWGTERWAVE